MTTVINMDDASGEKSLEKSNKSVGNQRETLPLVLLDNWRTNIGVFRIHQHNDVLLLYTRDDYDEVGTS